MTAPREVEVKSLLDKLLTSDFGRAFRGLRKTNPNDLSGEAEEWAKSIDPEYTAEAFESLIHLCRLWKDNRKTDCLEEALSLLWQRDMQESGSAVELQFPKVVLDRRFNSYTRYAWVLAFSSVQSSWSTVQISLRLLGDPDGDISYLAWLMLDRRLVYGGRRAHEELRDTVASEAKLVIPLAQIAGDWDMESYSVELEHALFQIFMPLLTHKKGTVSRAAAVGLQRLRYLGVDVPAVKRREKAMSIAMKRAMKRKRKRRESGRLRDKKKRNRTPSGG